MMRKAHYNIHVAGTDVTSKFEPRLLSLSIAHNSVDAAATATIELDDADHMLRFPDTGAPVSVRLGWQGIGARIFEGNVDTVGWAYDRGSGSVMSIVARSVDLRGKAKAPAMRNWENRKLGAILEEAASDAGISIKVHADLADRELAYEAQDGESFLAFADRLARQHGATFAIRGERAGFVPRNAGASASGEALVPIAISPGQNLISVSNMSPLTDRYRFSARAATWYDTRRAQLVIERIKAGDDVGPEELLQIVSPDAAAAGWAAETGEIDASRERGSGSLTIDGEPRATVEAPVVLSGVRPGIDGTYTIASVTDTLNRSSGYTTTLTLANPQGSAGVDGR